MQAWREIIRRTSSGSSLGSSISGSSRQSGSSHESDSSRESDEDDDDEESEHGSDMYSSEEREWNDASSNEDY